MNYGKRNTQLRVKLIDAKSVKIHHKIELILIKLTVICFMFITIIGVCAGIGVIQGILDSAPDITKDDVTPTGYSTTVLASDGTQTATLVASGSNRQYVSMDKIPKNLQHAFVAIEDARFYKHNGIDLQGILRATSVGLSTGHLSEGASTITQQLIKNNVLTTWTDEKTIFDSLKRKIQEQYLSIQLERKVHNKDWILENYLNSINLGANTLGVQAASNKYFGKDVSELTLSECAVIAGITQNPVAYNPITHPDSNAKRRQKVLKNMLDQGYIKQKDYNEALADNVYDRISEYNSTSSANVNSYFVDAMIDDVYNDLVEKKGYSSEEATKAIYQGGLTIHTTQDLQMQSIADEEANNLANYPTPPKYSFFLAFSVKHPDGTVTKYSNQTMLSYYKRKLNDQNYSINFNSEEECRNAIAVYENEVLKDGDTILDGSESINITLQPQVAMTIMDQKTGAVKALVGGRGQKEGNRTWNRATKTTRQPGSTFKIIACYAPGIDTGKLTLASVQDDAPYTVGSKTYRNANGKYGGFTTVRDAIAGSINIVAVKNLNEIGIDTGYNYAKKFGFTTLSDTDKTLGLALGGLDHGVTNLELTAAYSSIANSGTYIKPSFYTKVYDHKGNVILDISDKSRHRVIKETTAWLLTSAMQDVLTNGTGKRAYFGNEVMPQAGKSGTTTANRDSLFAGYTPYYTCVVWGGNDDNSVQTSAGTVYTKNIWRNVMLRIHQGLERKEFTQPAGIVTANVCKKSGLLPVDNLCDKDQRGSMVYQEFFAEGTVPTATCNHHVGVRICNATGKKAGANCPKSQTFISVRLTGFAPGSPEAKYGPPSETCPHGGGNPAPPAPATPPAAPVAPAVPTSATLSQYDKQTLVHKHPL